VAKCSVCGSELARGETYCSSCGSPVGGIVPLTSGAQTQRRPEAGTQTIVIVAAVGLLAIVALLLASSTGLGGGGGGALIVGGATTSTAAATSTATPAPSPVVPPVIPPAPAKPAAPKPDTSEDGKFATLVTEAEYGPGGAQQISFDYIQFFTGAAAEKEAAKHGDIAENGYYVLNDNPKIRTYDLKSGTKILIHSMGDPNIEHLFTFDEFRDLLSGATLTYGGDDYTATSGLFWVTISNHQVTAMEDIWLP